MTHIKKLEKLTDNPFLNLYHIDFEKRDGTAGNYYFASRNKEADLKINTRSQKPEGLTVYAVTREKEPRIVLVREYRFPLDAAVYTLPAGLIDEGETSAQAAAREMREETGFHFTEYTGGKVFYRNPFLLAPGITDESGTVVFGYADTTGGEAQPEASEWIEPFLADKEEARRILKEEAVSTRCAFLLFAFLASPADRPFSFLEG